MDYRFEALSMCKWDFKKIISTLFFTVLLPGAASAVTNHYEGHGISFDYPAKYTLSETRKKSSDSIKLKNGSDSMEVGVMDNVLMDGFDDVVIKAITGQFKDKGYTISDVRREVKQIPLHVTGENSSVNVDAVKYYHVVEIVQDDIPIKVLQTLFFFSYGDHGYMVNYSRIKAKYSDLVTLLSSFRFDEKEVAENDGKAALY